MSNAITKRMAMLFDKMVAIRKKAEDELRDMTKKEVEERAKIKKDIEDLVPQLESADDEKEVRELLYGKPDGSEHDVRTMQTGELRPGEQATARTAAPRGRDYRSLFGVGKTVPLDRSGFKDFDEFLAVLHSGRSDARLKMFEERAMTVGTPSAGGFIVPDEFAAWLLDASLEGEIIRPRATVWPMASKSKLVPGWDMGDHSSSLFGGLTGQWLAESASATEVYAKLRQINLQAKKLGCYTSASNELVADGVSFEAQLSGALTKTIGFYLDYAFINGSGAGQPLGILNDPALVEVTPETAQAADTIVYDNVVKMFSRLAPQCVKNAVWIANQTTIPQLLTLVIAVGTGGQMAQAVTQSNGRFYLLTREVLFTEKCPALGEKGDLIFADISQYSIGLRKEVSLDKSNAPGWLKDESSYRAIVRADGQGQWDRAVTPKNGDALSWCVALGARE